MYIKHLKKFSIYFSNFKIKSIDLMEKNWFYSFLFCIGIFKELPLTPEGMGNDFRRDDKFDDTVYCDNIDFKRISCKMLVRNIKKNS